jgi:hypothetical protein
MHNVRGMFIIIIDMESLGARSTTSGEMSPNLTKCRSLASTNKLPSKSSACVDCRSKHLKCDGLQNCARCVAQGIACIYLKSRRGYRGPGVNKKQVASTTNGKFCAHVVDDLADQKESPSKKNFTILDSIEPSWSSIASISPVPGDVVCSLLDLPPMTQDTNSTTIGSKLGQPNHRHQCIEAFFKYCYHTHPFLLPRHQFLQTLETNPINILETALCYIGSRYVPGILPTPFALQFDSYLSPTSATPKDASMVQAMLWFALGLDRNNDQKKAIEILIKAQSLAVELGMNQPEFAEAHSQGSSIYEESLRRTWWELYVVCVMVAGFHGKETFHLRDIISNVPVPCEEKEFTAGVSQVQLSIRERT